jgi:hypothetical protein
MILASCAIFKKKSGVAKTFKKIFYKNSNFLVAYGEVRGVDFIEQS